MVSVRETITPKDSPKKPKRILFCHASAELYGADYVLLELCKYLKSHGHEPIVILPFRGPLCDEFDRLAVRYYIRDMPVLRRKYFTPWGMIQYAWLTLSSIRQVSALVAENKIDLYHTNTAGVWTGGILAKLQGRPHIWQVMELVEKPKAVAFVMGQVVGRLATRVFCISDATKNHFLRYNRTRASRFETLYHGVDLDFYAPEKTDGKKPRALLDIPATATVILYAGRFSAWKGQDVFAQAAAKVLSDSPAGADVRFIMLGSCFQGQECHETELKAILETIPNREVKVYTPGFQKNLPDWMAAADVFVLPSKNPEPNATVLIAAMVMGLPCIGTNIGGTVETIADGETGILIPPADSGALAAAMRELAVDAQKRRRMGKAGQARAARLFSLRTYCETIEASYE